MSSSTEVHGTQVWNLNAVDVHARSKSKQALNSNADDKGRKSDEALNSNADELGSISEEVLNPNAGFLRNKLEEDFSQSMWNEIKEKVYKPSHDKSDIHERSKSQCDIRRPTPIPSIVFSVIGHSISFFPRPWPKAVFQTALIEAAKSGGETWILYRVSGYEVSNLVENAYQHYENLEFGNDSVDIHDRRRHIKLIDISGKKTGQQPEKDSPSIFKTEKGEKDSLTLNFEQFISQQDIEYIEEYVSKSIFFYICIYNTL